MGEYADLTLDQYGWDDEDDEFLDYDKSGYVPSRRGRTVKCKYCGRRGFVWKETDAGWRLATRTGKIHVCKAFHAKRER